MHSGYTGYLTCTTSTQSMEDLLYLNKLQFTRHSPMHEPPAGDSRFEIKDNAMNAEQPCY